MAENKCVWCGRKKGEHRARTMNCPMGKKHRILGFTDFNPTEKFRQREPLVKERAK